MGQNGGISRPLLQKRLVGTEDETDQNQAVSGTGLMARAADAFPDDWNETTELKQTRSQHGCRMSLRRIHSDNVNQELHHCAEFTWELIIRPGPINQVTIDGISVRQSWQLERNLTSSLLRGNLLKLTMMMNWGRFLLWEKFLSKNHKSVI